MTLHELAEQAGVPARTIRFYIAKGLMPGPLTAGRGAAYDDSHLARLAEVQRLKAEGKSLVEVRHALVPAETPASLPAPTRWASYAIAEDVVVNVREDAGPWRSRQIQAFLHEMARRFQDETREGEAK